MNQPQATTTPEKGVEVVIRIEITTTIQGGRTLTNIVEQAKEITEKAKNYGAVKSELVLGPRQRLPIS